jgi:hypothetical protein
MKDCIALPRVLCLRLEGPHLDLNLARRPLAALAESFLQLSPRVAHRAPALIFVEISGTAHLLCPDAESSSERERGVLHRAREIASTLGLSVQAAISDTAPGAQVLAMLNQDLICTAGEERVMLRSLPLPLLLHLEGLEPWPAPGQVRRLVDFLKSVGLQEFGDLSRLSLAGLQERWPSLGPVIWRRAQALEAQVISPLLPTEDLDDCVHFDFPVSLVSILSYQLQESLLYLFGRLQGRRLFARRIQVLLHFEYSQKQQSLAIEPHTASRNLSLFLTLLEQKLDSLCLDNPVRMMEISVTPGPEKTRQMDLFEPRESAEDRLELLFNLLLQQGYRPGFFRPQARLRPEESWTQSLRPEPKPDNSYQNSNLFMVSTTSTEISTEIDPIPAVSSRPLYSARLSEAPRPNRLLDQPRKIDSAHSKRLRLLSSEPIERIEDRWWSEDGISRDYFMAKSEDGQFLWVYRSQNDLFLHGYFD